MTNTLQNIALKKIDSSQTTLAEYGGKVLLVVNVASKCGLTPQYEGLEKLYRSRHADGLEVLGFPANNFKGQEPGTEQEIMDFCATTYDVHFPMFAKISVKGEDQHPLYAELTKVQPKAQGDGPFRENLKKYGIEAPDNGDVLWNFEKFLIGRNGQVVARFAPDVNAEDPRLLSAIETELGKAP